MDHIMYYCSINSNAISKDTSIRDLGILLDNKLTFKPNFQSIMSSGCRNLCFIIQNSHHFSVICLKMLFYSLVKSNLEYACIIWSSYYQCDIDNIKRVHKKFLHRCVFRFRFDLKEGNYPLMLKILNLESLKNLWFTSDLCHVL